jgi:RNA polymerase sigma-70 factor (ECF subfamily)
VQGSRTTGRDTELEGQLEQHRSELTGYCYRMLGSAFEADDAVQETMVRAWRSLDRFEGRAALRTWLYRIATNVCFDMLNGRQRRARPMDLGPAQPHNTPLTVLPDNSWIEPVPEGRVGAGGDQDPAELAVARESIRLAFVAALAELPPRQRAVLILREVLRWRAEEVAQLLDTSVASVNSALQRARATVAQREDAEGPATLPLDAEHQELLARYVDAFERFDVDTLVTLIHDDARFTMPPFALWLVGTSDIHGFYLGTGSGCEGSRLVPVASANGCPAFGHYKPSETGEGFDPWSVQLLEMSGGRITGLHHFLDVPRMFPLFGLPLQLDP